MKILYSVLLLIVTEFCAAQHCPMNPGYRYNLYLFSKDPLPLDQLLGKGISPVHVNYIHVKNSEEKIRTDSLCLSRKMPLSIFIYAQQNNIVRYCNQQEYVDALNKNENPEVY